MTLDEFEAALDLYGASLAVWPETQRADATEVLAQSSAAQAMLAAAQEVEALLAATRFQATTGIDRIVAVATAQPQPRASTLRLPRAGWRYAACVAVALAGFALGVADRTPQSDQLDQLVNVAFGPADPFDAL